MSTSGGSTPMFKHITSATDVVFMRSFMRQRETSAARGRSSAKRALSRHNSAASCQSSQKNSGYSDSCISGDMACIAPPAGCSGRARSSRETASAPQGTAARASHHRCSEATPRRRRDAGAAGATAGDTAGSIGRRGRLLLLGDFAFNRRSLQRDTRGGTLLTHLASPRPSLLASYLVSSVSKGRARKGPPSELHARVPTNAGGASRLGFSGDCVGARFRSFAGKSSTPKVYFRESTIHCYRFRRLRRGGTTQGAPAPTGACSNERGRANAACCSSRHRHHHHEAHARRAAQAKSKSEPSRFRAASRAGAADTLSPGGPTSVASSSRNVSYDAPSSHSTHSRDVSSSTRAAASSASTRAAASAASAASAAAAAAAAAARRAPAPPPSRRRARRGRVRTSLAALRRAVGQLSQLVVRVCQHGSQNAQLRACHETRRSSRWRRARRARPCARTRRRPGRVHVRDQVDALEVRLARSGRWIPARAVRSLAFCAWPRTVPLRRRAADEPRLDAAPLEFSRQRLAARRALHEQNALVERDASEHVQKRGVLLVVTAVTAVHEKLPHREQTRGGLRALLDSARVDRHRFDARHGFGGVRRRKRERLRP